MIMKKAAVLILILALFTGCSVKEEELDRAMTLRAKLLANSCSFDAEITADYGEKIHKFSLACEGDPQGNLKFAVTQPESISGITGTISQEGGKLTFDDTGLHFDLLADDQISPVAAPWILLKTLRGGYLNAANMEDGMLRLTIDDSYEEDALQVDIWLNEADQPFRAEILYDGRRILTVNVNHFQIL